MSAPEGSQPTDSTQSPANGVSHSSSSSFSSSPASTPVHEAGNNIGMNHGPLPGMIVLHAPPPTAPPMGVAAPDMEEDVDDRIDCMSLATWQSEFRNYGYQAVLYELHRTVDEHQHVARDAGQEFDRAGVALILLSEEADARRLTGEVRERFIEWFLFIGGYVDDLPRTGLPTQSEQQ